MTSRSLPPVVLLGGLPIVRALGLAGIPVVVATSDPRSHTAASRYCHGVVSLPPFTDRKGVAEALVRVGKEMLEKHGVKAPLFYDNDDRLKLVQDFRAELEPHFALLLNEPELDAALLDKALFQELGESRGLPVPRRIEWEALSAHLGPVLVKPKMKTAWDDSNVHNRLFGGAGKARIFDSGRAARMDPLVRTLAAQLTFQEYVPGDDDAIWSFHGFAAPGGEVLASFVGRKIRTFPAGTGDSSYIRLEHDDEVERLGRGIALRLPLAGVFKMDFKKHGSRFYLFEINTRFNLWNYPAAMNGVNLPQVAFCFLTNQPVEKQAAKARYRWLSFRYDWQAYRELSALGKLTFTDWLLSLLEAPKVYELWAWRDPRPFVRHWSARLRQAAARRMHRWLATAS